MAPCTFGGLAHGMAYDDHIRHENYEFGGVQGPTPMSAYSHGLNLHHGDLRPVACGRHTLRTALCASIPEFTYEGGQYSHSSLAIAKSFAQEARSPWLVTKSSREWPQSATSFRDTTRLSAPMGQHPSPAPTLARPTMWETWVR
jgi:hypothetical protein